MPELAEVEYYRRQWDAGLRGKITAVHLHAEKRVFRGTHAAMIKNLEGKKLIASEASGKQMLFRFSGDLWLGIHLGMTGKLSLQPAKYEPGKHDHLVLFQKKCALVFTDARQFGRVIVHQGSAPPVWWSRIGPAVTSKEFTLDKMSGFLDRHAKLPVKASLLLQGGFPGIGNWMADEILWRAGVTPRKKSLSEAEKKRLWRETRFVAREAVAKISSDFGDPPRNWLFHERWKRAGICPRHKTPLRKETIGGRTTAWCPQCQK